MCDTNEQIKKNRYDYSKQSYRNLLMADDFCKFFSSQIRSHLLESPSKTRKYHRDNKMSDADIITILVLSHMMGYRGLNHFYLNYVCVNMQYMFPNTVSYNRFVELQQPIMLRLTIFI